MWSMMPTLCHERRVYVMLIIDLKECVLLIFFYVVRITQGPGPGDLVRSIAKGRPFSSGVHFVPVLGSAPVWLKP
jgi:hypothetical protein